MRIEEVEKRRTQLASEISCIINRFNNEELRIDRIFYYLSDGENKLDIDLIVGNSKITYKWRENGFKE